MKRIRNHEKELLLKCLAGKASAEEMESAWEWIGMNQSHEAYYKSLRDAWISDKVNEELEPQQLQKAWERLEKKIRLETGIKTKTIKKEFRETFYISMPWTRLAAAVIIAFLLGGLGFVYVIEALGKSTGKSAWYTIEAPRGAKSLITLSDGSKVWLNAGSKLKYSRNYNLKDRDLHLEGEAYFEVARNEALTLQVHTSGIVVRALGTEFNVKAYPGEGKVETTLVKGSVSIIRDEMINVSGAQGIVLLPNQKASYFTDNNITQITQVKHEEQLTTEPAQPIRPRGRVRIESNINTDVATSWREKRWVFERENMQSLATTLERNYDVTIIFKSDEIKDFHLTGTLEEESIEQVLMALQLTLPINFEITGNTVYLSVNQQKLIRYKQLLRNQK